jgi:hypothetical protein
MTTNPRSGLINGGASSARDTCGSSARLASEATWTLLKTWSFCGVSDSIPLVELEMNRCGASLDFLMSTNA